ncbi:hypothetical protein ABZ454_38710, partial [Streptomyces sp. NPDC005803]|uniref:hypothetical protein n=1 Tax=Streptomyces sp. NPDC005803 TaxID=3154297 RepID=UPI0033EC65F4
GHHPSVSEAPNGNFAMRVLVDAPTIERAQDDALTVCDRAMHAAYGRAAVVGIEVLTEEELDRRNTEHIPLPDLAGRTEVAKILGVSPTRAGQIIRTKRFQEHAPIVQELAAGPVCLAYQVRRFADIWHTLPGPKPAEHSKDS